MTVPATSRQTRTFEDRADALAHFFLRAGEAPRLIAYDDAVGCPLDQALAAIEWTSAVGILAQDDVIHAARLGADAAAHAVVTIDAATGKLGWRYSSPSNAEIYAPAVAGNRAFVVGLDRLLNLRRYYPVSLHGVALSLGSAEELDRVHLGRFKALIERVEPMLVSEHLAWSAIGGVYLNDLLPLPYTEESLDVFCRHVEEVQEEIGRRLLIENPASYLRYHHSSIPRGGILDRGRPPDGLRHPL